MYMYSLTLGYRPLTLWRKALTRRCSFLPKPDTRVTYSLMKNQIDLWHSHTHSFDNFNTNFMFISQNSFNIKLRFVNTMFKYLHIYEMNRRWRRREENFIIESLRSTTRPAQQRGLNFSSRMSAKQFYCCNKCLKIFQITLQTAKFD
jgi:hypothetical protein